MIRAVAIILGFISLSAFHTGYDQYRCHTALALVLGAFFLLAPLSRRVGITGALFFSYVVATSVCVFSWKTSPYAEFDFSTVTDMSAPIAILCIESVVAASLVFFLLTTVPVLFFRKPELEACKFAFAFICAADSVWMIANWCLGNHVCGVCDASSVDACFVAMSYPLLVIHPSKRPYDPLNLMSVRKFFPFAVFEALCVVLPLVAIGVSKSSTGYGAILVVGGIWALTRYGVKRVSLVSLALAAPAILLGRVLCGSDLFNDSHRFAIWSTTLAYWRANLDVWTGAGLGSFAWFGPRILQKTASYPGDSLVIWMHNDFAQTAFDLGLAGLALLLVYYFRRLVDCFRNKPAWLTCSWGALGFVGLFQMPTKLGVTAFFTAILCRLVSPTERP